MTPAPWPIDGPDVLTQVRRIVWRHEGGEHGTAPHTHPQDLGGRTRAGLTWRCYSEDYLRLPAGTLCPVAQFDALTLDDIVQVMLEVFALRPNLWHIDDARLRFIVLDTAILFGVGRAVMFLQHALGVRADGILGAQTLDAIARHPAIDRVRELVVSQRIERHAARIVQRPDQLAFLLGWMRRSGTVLAWRAALLLMWLLQAPTAVAQDGFELPTGTPRSSWGYAVPEVTGS